jgi:subtilisin family serine protease
MPACGYPRVEWRFGPLEAYQPVFDAIATATAKGIIVVEAAGNGNVDLDGSNCEGLFDRSVRDSGAIIVGAGLAANRTRLVFSSYGSRVDVQGWGNAVTTTGYGDAFPTLDVRERYTKGFSGTSSASPMVAGAAIAIQGVLKACGKSLLTPQQMRNLLVNTGAEQPAGGGHIGPMPRVDAALRASPAWVCMPLDLPGPPGGIDVSQLP